MGDITESQTSTQTKFVQILLGQIERCLNLENISPSVENFLVDIYVYITSNSNISLESLLEIHSQVLEMLINEQSKESIPVDLLGNPIPYHFSSVAIIPNQTQFRDEKSKKLKREEINRALSSYIEHQGYPDFVAQYFLDAIITSHGEYPHRKLDSIEESVKLTNTVFGDSFQEPDATIGHREEQRKDIETVEKQEKKGRLLLSIARQAQQRNHRLAIINEDGDIVLEVTGIDE